MSGDGDTQHPSLLQRLRSSPTSLVLLTPVPLPSPLMGEQTLHRMGLGSEDAANVDKVLLNDKLIHRFLILPIKIPIDIFAEIDKLNLEY